MKKITAILAAMLMISLVACGSTGKTASDSGASTDAVSSEQTSQSGSGESQSGSGESISSVAFESG